MTEARSECQVLFTAIDGIMSPMIQAPLNIQRPAEIADWHMSTTLFCIAYGYWLLLSVIGGSCFTAWVPNIVWSTLQPTVFMLLIAAEILENRKLDDLVPFLLLLALAKLVEQHSSSDSILHLVVFIWCARRVSFKIIAIESLTIIIATCAMIVVASQMGIILDYIWEKGTRNRHGLGFLYCTTLSHYILNVAILLVLLRQERITAYEIVLVACIDIWVFFMTNSRNSFVLTLFLLAAVILLKFFRLEKKPGGLAIAVVSVLPFIVFPLTSLLFSIIYDPSVGWMNELNAFTGSRIRAQSHSLHTYGVAPFGQSIHLAGNGIDANGVLEKSTGTYDSNYVDNSFMSLLIHRGIFVYIGSVVLYLCIGMRVVRSGNWYLAFGLLAVALHSMFDPQMIDPQFSTIIFLGYRRICASDIEILRRFQWPTKNLMERT